MKSIDEIVIIMLQWMRLYTLGSRGSRELKTFLETRLVSSRVDQKLSFKGRNTLVLKRKLARRSWPIEAIVEAVWRSHGSDSLGRHRGFLIGLKYAWIWLQSSLKKTMFSATIEPRSWVNHDPRSPSVVVLIDGGDSIA